MNRFLNLFRREKLSTEITRELDFHLRERTEQLIASGMPPRAAATQARRQFGAYVLHKEETFETDLLTWLGTFAADLRYALRGLVKSPGFAAAAILSLALGIGANTAIFSLINAVMLRSLPVRHPEELLKVATVEDQDYFTNPAWEALRDRQDVFSGAFAWGNSGFNVAPDGEARYLHASYVSGDFFNTLGVNPAAGRLLSMADDKRGCPGVAVISESFWQREYGGDFSVVGKNIPLDGQPFQIVGVTQRAFTGMDVGRSPDIYAPLCSEAILRGPNSSLDRRSSWWLRISGRPKPGMTPSQIQARLAVLAPEVWSSTLPPNRNPKSQQKYLNNKFQVASASGGYSQLATTYGQALWTLMAAVGLVLLIACANVANLLLARSAARQREMAVRLALGAGRGRLIRQSLTESLLLSLCGAALGLVFALWGSRLLTLLISTRGDEVFLNLTPDTTVLLFAAALSVATGLLFGAVPAWRSSQVAPNAAIKAQGRGITEGGARMRLGKALVVAQVAISMVLVAGAALMLSSFRNLSTLNPGFSADGVMVVDIHMSWATIPKEARIGLRNNVLERFRAVPGVRAASASNVLPISGGTSSDILKVEGPSLVQGEEIHAYSNAVTDRYFETMGVKMIAGRDFNAHDNLASPRVAVISESLARQLFGNANPLGRTFRLSSGKDFGPPTEIVGIAADAKYRDLREPLRPTMYNPLSQQEGTWLPNYEVHTTGSQSAMITLLKQAIAGANPHLTMEFTPLSQQVSDSLRQERMLATLSAFFGALALLLAAIGLYGVLSYNVARRRNEIGIRMALGAAQTRILRMMLQEAGRLTAIGLCLGLAATLLATRLVKALLFGLQADDPPTLALSAIVLTAVAIVAAYLPARRAAMVDPMTALRDE